MQGQFQPLEYGVWAGEPMAASAVTVTLYWRPFIQIRHVESACGGTRRHLRTVVVSSWNRPDRECIVSRETCRISLCSHCHRPGAHSSDSHARMPPCSIHGILFVR